MAYFISLTSLRQGMVLKLAAASCGLWLATASPAIAQSESVSAAEASSEAEADGNASTPTSTKASDRSRPTSIAGRPGSRAPDFILTDSAGYRHHLARVTSDLIVLEWTSLACPEMDRAYRDQAPQKLAARYATRGVAWLAISPPLDPTRLTHQLLTRPSSESTDQKEIDSPRKVSPCDLAGHARAVDTWRKGHRLQYPVLMDPKEKITKKYAVERSGTYVVIHRGRIVYRGRFDNSGQPKNEVRINYVARAIQEVLAGHRVSIPETKLTSVTSTSQQPRG